MRRGQIDAVHLPAEGLLHGRVETLELRVPLPDAPLVHHLRVDLVTHQPVLAGDLVLHVLLASGVGEPGALDRREEAVLPVLGLCPKACGVPAK